MKIWNSTKVPVYRIFAANNTGKSCSKTTLISRKLIFLFSGNYIREMLIDDANGTNYNSLSKSVDNS